MNFDEELSDSDGPRSPSLTAFPQAILDQHSCAKCGKSPVVFLCCHEECSIILCDNCAESHEHGELIDVKKSVGHMRMYIASNGRGIKDQLAKTLSRRAEVAFEKTKKLELTTAVKVEVNQWARRLHDVIDQECGRLVGKVESMEKEYEQIVDETDKKLKDFEIKLKDMYNGFAEFQRDELALDDLWTLYADLSDPDFPNHLVTIGGNTKAPRWDLRTVAFKKNETVLKFLEQTPVLLGEVSKVSQICYNMVNDQFPSAISSVAFIDDDKLISVIDRANKAIKCFPNPSHLTLAGKETKMKAFTGEGEYKLQGPDAICHNHGKTAAMIVSDMRQNCLIGFNTDGQGLWKVDVEEPKCICVAGKKLYVGSNKRLHVFDRGEQVKRVDVRKIRHSATSIAVAQNGNIGTCDQDGKFRIMNKDFKEVKVMEGEFDGGELKCRQVCNWKDGNGFLVYDEKAKRLVEISADGEFRRTASREGDPGIDVCPSVFTVSKKGHILGGTQQLGLVKKYPLSKLQSPSGVLHSIKN